MMYEVIEKDPYLGHELPDNSRGLVIKSLWDNRFIDLIKENNLKYLYLNYAHGWKCSDYSFLNDIPPVAGIRILDIHSKGIHALESQKWLKSISLNVRIDENINFKNFEKLEDCFLGWSKNCLLYTSYVYGLPGRKRRILQENAKILRKHPQNDFLKLALKGKEN